MGTAFSRGAPAWQGYVLALVLTLAAIALRRWLDVLGDEIVPFALFYPVVLVCALLWGIGPSILSLLISGVAVTIFWLEPRGVLGLSGSGVINFLLFAITNSASIFVAHLLRSANDRLERNQARLALAQEVGKIGAWEWNLRTGRLWWSPTLYEVTGISPETPPSIDTYMAHIHPSDRDQANEALEAARSGVRRLETEFRFRKDDGTTIWLAGRAELLRDADGHPSRLVGISFDLTPLRKVESERDRANSLLHSFFECLPGAAYVKDAEGRLLLGNPGFAAAIGGTPETFLGKTDAEFLADEVQARAMMENDRAVLKEGASLSFEEDLLLPNGRLTHWLSVKTPFLDAEERPQGIIGVSLDITERRKAEEKLRFLADEVDHRAKNLLGVVQSILRLTRVDDVTAFKTAVIGRIQALARAHTLLAASRWQGVDIAALIEQELAPFKQSEAERIRACGPALTLEANMSQAFAMAIHELAINAAKHGALSVEHGRLDVCWELEEQSGQKVLKFEWSETGGPMVTAPDREGFGSSAIRGAIEHQLGGEIDLVWVSTGLRCRFHVPLPGRTGQDPGTASTDATIPESAVSHASSSAKLDGKRVLIVDDEALIALSLKDGLEDLGCEIMGPASSAAAALDLIKERAPDVAVLDVNLAGGTSARVAKALRALAVPYVYCTGYVEPASHLDAELGAEMLTKPCDPQELAAALRRALT